MNSNGPSSDENDDSASNNGSSEGSAGRSSGFGNPDERPRGDWKSKYCKAARYHQWKEFGVLIAYLLVAIVSSLVLFWLADTDVSTASSNPGGNGESRERTVTALSDFFVAAFALSGGLLGGTLFSIKWLYHSVAKLIWHLDRRFWRLLTPCLSAGLAMAIAMLTASDIVNIFDTDAVRSPATCFGIGFLVGYFSDAAIGKLAEVALTLFGTTGKQRSGRKSNRDPDTSDRMAPSDEDRAKDGPNGTPS